jgi:hypothetical protein
MISSHISQSEAARATAIQAEFNEKKWVWVPDEKEGYVSGWINKEEGDEGEVVLATSSEVWSRLDDRFVQLVTFSDTKGTTICIIQDESAEI